VQPRPPRVDPIRTDAERPFERHVFVCTDGPECPGDGPAVEIRSALKRAAKEAGLRDVVRVNKSGCLDQCGHGPMMVVYPEGVWYAHLTVEDALEVFREHVVERRPVERLRYTLGPGGCKALRNADGSSSCAGACRRGA